MTSAREEQVVSVAELAGLIAETSGAPAPAGTTARRNQAIADLVAERRTLGERIYRADQNEFRAQLAPGWVLDGAPDLITEARDGSVHVFVVRDTLGEPRDLVEVELYLWGLPRGMRRYANAPLTGWVVVPDGTRERVSPQPTAPQAPAERIHASLTRA